MADWQFDGSDFDALDITSCTVTKAAGGMDSAELVFAKSGTATAPATLDADVVIKDHNGADFFRGIVADVRPFFAGEEEFWRVRLAGQMSALDRIVYQQTRACVPATSGGSVVMKADSSVILGWSSSGVRQDTAGMISDILTYAATQSSGVTAGTILSGTAITVPQMEMTDAMCRECIQSVLRWHPDAVLWLDHASGAVNVTRPGSMSTESRAGTGDTSYCVALDVAPRKVRTVRGVVINWRVTSTLDNLEHVDIVQDTAGATSGRNVVVITIPLAGPSTTTQVQDIETEDIPQNVGDVTGAWLEAKFPALAECAPGAGQLSVKSITQDVASDEEMGPGATLSSYPRELLTGQVQPWMAGVSACPVTVTVELAYTAARSANPKLYDRFFRGAAKTVKLQVKLTGTDATTREYTTSATVPGESPVTGLAADYYAAMNADQPEGRAVFVGEECDVALKPGRRLTLTGDKAVTTAVIQQVDYDIMEGRTVVTFGPVGVRQPADLVELMRAGSRSRPLANVDGSHRTSSTPTASTKIKGATGGRMADTQDVPAARELLGFEVTMASTSSVAVAGGRVLTPDLTALTGSDGLGGHELDPTHIGAELDIASGTLSVVDGSGVYLKLNYERHEYYLVTGGSEGITDSNTDTHTLEWEVTQWVYVWRCTSAEFAVSSAVPTSSKETAYVKLAQIGISGGVMSIAQIHRGAVQAYPLTIVGPASLALGNPP